MQNTEQKSKPRSQRKSREPETRPKSKVQQTLHLAAVKALRGRKRPMTCGEIIEVIIARGYFTTTGKTPARTLATTIIRDAGATFEKVERGKYLLKKSA